MAINTDDRNLHINISDRVAVRAEVVTDSGTHPSGSISQLFADSIKDRGTEEPKLRIVITS